jgi:hypothetical protein
MLNRRRDDMSPVRRGSFPKPANGEVVCFSPAGGENDLILLRANQRRDLTPRAIHRRASLLPKAMDTRRIAEVLDHGASHRGRDSRVHRRRGAVIQVNSTDWIRHLKGSLPQRGTKRTKRLCWITLGSFFQFFELFELFCG